LASSAGRAGERWSLRQYLLVIAASSSPMESDVQPSSLGSEVSIGAANGEGRGKIDSIHALFAQKSSRFLVQPTGRVISRAMIASQSDRQPMGLTRGCTGRSLSRPMRGSRR